MVRWMKVALLSLGLSVVPVSYALADSAEPQKAGAEKGKKGEHAEKHFPMAGAEFLEKVESRTAKVKERLAKRLANKNVAAEKQKEIMADFDAGAARVKSAAEAAAKDGTVTLEEAKQVRSVVKEVRKELREEHHPGRGKANGKDKDKDKDKDGKGKGKANGKGKGQPA